MSQSRTIQAPILTLKLYYSATPFVSNAIGISEIMIPLLSQCNLVTCDVTRLHLRTRNMYVRTGWLLFRDHARAIEPNACEDLRNVGNGYVPLQRQRPAMKDVARYTSRSRCASTSGYAIKFLYIFHFTKIVGTCMIWAHECNHQPTRVYILTWFSAPDLGSFAIKWIACRLN